MRIPNVDTFGDLVDRLIVEVNKLAFFENAKRKEHASFSPDPEVISRLDDASRDCCELRSMLKSRINECLAEIVRSGEYRVMREVRTFRPPDARLSDVLADACRERSDAFSKALVTEILP